MNFAPKPRLFYLSIFISGTIFKANAQISYTKEDSAKIYNICNRAAYWLNENNGLDSALWLCNGALQISQAKQFKRGEANALLKLSEILFKKSETGQVNFYNETALHTGELFKDSSIIASAYKNMGAYYSYFSKQKEAIGYFEKALSFKYEKEQSSVTADIYNRTGNASMEMGDLEKEMQWQTKALKLFEKVGDKKGAASAMDNIAGLYLELGKNNQAIGYGKQSVLIRESVNNYEELATGYNDLSQYYFFSDSLKKAQYYAALGLKYAALSGIKNTLAHAYTSQSLLYNRSHKNNEALEFEKKAIAILELTGDDIMLSRRYIAAAILSQSRQVNDSAGALYYYQKAIDLASKINAKINLRDVYLFRSQFFRSRKDFEKGYEDYFKHILYRDSLINEDTKAKITDIEAKYETEKKDNEIKKLYADQRIRQLEIERQNALLAGNKQEAQRKQNEIELLSKEKELQKLKIRHQDEELEKQLLQARNTEQQIKLATAEKQINEKEIAGQKTVKNFLIAGLGLILLLGGILFNRFQLKKKLEQQKQLSLMRNSISKDLHDDIGASLSNINILTELARRNIAQPEKASGYLSKAAEDIQRISESLSDIVWNINPRYDDPESLFIRMKRYAADMLDGKNIKGEFDFPGPGIALSITMTQRRDLYLIFKEAVNNLVKYSGAENAEIKIAVDNKRINMLVKDDGKGFDKNLEKNGNGLSNMQQRAVSAGGTLSVTSSPGKGTKVVLEI